MNLRQFFSAETVNIDLQGESKDDLIRELVGLLGVDRKSSDHLVATIKRREALGSTGIGKGIAIPHCRSTMVSRLQLAYGRKSTGVDFKAIDGQPVYNFFLIVAPHRELSNQYLPVLGKIAQFAKDPDVPERLHAIESAEEFLELLDAKAS